MSSLPWLIFMLLLIHICHIMMLTPPPLIDHGVIDFEVFFHITGIRDKFILLYLLNKCLLIHVADGSSPVVVMV